MRYTLRRLWRAISMGPFSTGRWVAKIVYDWNSPGLGANVPSRRRLTFNTRKMTQRQVLHYWPDDQGPGTIPSVESWVMSMDITPWFGRPYTLYRVESNVQYFIAGRVYTFNLGHIHDDSGRAYADFNACSFPLRALAYSLGDPQPFHVLISRHAGSE